MNKDSFFKPFLKQSEFFQFSHPKIQSIYKQLNLSQNTSVEENIASLFHYVRDAWNYQPYVIGLNPDALTTENIISRKEGHCLDKAVILIALLRGAGIPARLGLAEVINHIGVEKIIESFGTEVLAPHGYTEAWNGQKWVKLTPAFNKELCHYLKVKPLEYKKNGIDALFQSSNEVDKKFMEYTKDLGVFNTVPITFINECLLSHYPQLITIPEIKKRRVNFKKYL